MRKLAIIGILLLSASLSYGQNRLIKPEAAVVEVPDEVVFPQPVTLFPDSAMKKEIVEFYEKEIENRSGSKNNRNQAVILFCFSELYRLDHEYRKALLVLKDVHRAIGDTLAGKARAVFLNRVINNFAALAEKEGSAAAYPILLVDMGYNTPNALFTELEAFFKEKEDALNILALYKSAFLYYTSVRMFEKAHMYGELLIYYREYVADRIMEDQLATLKAMYNMNQKEQEIQLLNAQKILNEQQIITRQREQWAITGVVGVLLVFVLALVHRVRTIRRTRDLLEAKARQYQHEKHRAERNERFREQFLANMSHEIRTPMNAIKGITNILIRHDHPVSQEKYLNAMHKSADNLLVLINDILDLSKLGAGKLEMVQAPFILNDIIEEVSVPIKGKAKNKGLEYMVDYNSRLPEVLIGDGIVLNNILVNLLNNAVSFTNEGSVKLSVDGEEKQDGTVLVKIAISDTGVGIVREKQDQLLKTFVKVYDNDAIQYKGSGLELAIINQQVILQGGTIRLESEPGVGTKFFLEIPYLVAQDIADHGIGKTAIQDHGLENIAILLVEDNDFNVMVVTTELESAIEGLKLDVAGNGSIALKKLQDESYDLILMDVLMPVMDGYETTRRIRNMDGPVSDIPIIAMTANTLQQEIEKCLNKGMNDYVAKPFDTDELIAKINTLIQRKNA